MRKLIVSTLLLAIVVSLIAFSSGNQNLYCGDPNGDGVIDIADVIAIGDIMQGNVHGTGDCNGDGITDMADAEQLLAYLMGVNTVTEMEQEAEAVAATLGPPVSVPAVCPGPFIRGDTNADGLVDISDVVTSLFSIFVPGVPPIECADRGDANDDGLFDISDSVYQLAALFVPGAPGIPLPSGPLPGGYDEEAIAGWMYQDGVDNDGDGIIDEGEGCPATTFEQTLASPPSLFVWNIYEVRNCDGYILVGRDETFTEPYVRKMDYTGATEWDNIYLTSFTGGYVIDAKQTADGGYILAITSLLPANGAIFKITSGGFVEWTIDLPGVRLAALDLIGDDDYVVVGSQNNDVVVTRFTVSGFTLWTEVYGDATFSEMPADVDRTSDGGAIIAGTSFSTGSSTMLLKIEDDGTQEFLETYSVSPPGTSESVVDVDQLPDGSYIISGTVAVSSVLGSGGHVYKIDSDGVLDWEQAYTSTYNLGDVVYNPAVNEYKAIGTTDVYPYDVILLTLDSQGILLSDITYSTGSGRTLERTDDGGYLIGSFQSGGVEYNIRKTDSVGMI